MPSRTSFTAIRCTKEDQLKWGGKASAANKSLRLWVTEQLNKTDTLKDYEQHIKALTAQLEHLADKYFAESENNSN